MNAKTRSDAPILVLSEDAGDAGLVKRLLETEFDNIKIATQSDTFVKVFDTCPAEVLVLAFKSLEIAQRHYLALYKQSQKIHMHPHRTVMLCDKDNVREAYELCRRSLFDDYMLFWPLTHDSPRLLMSVHLALRELSALKDGGPTAAEFAAQARHIASLEGMLAQQMATGEAQIQNTVTAAAKAEEQVGSALDGFSRRIASGQFSEVLEVKNAAGLGKAFDRFKQEELQLPLRAVGNAAAPLTQWAKKFRSDVEPHLEAARSLTAMAERVKPTVLVVDDDDLHRKLIGTLLRGDDYRLLFAVGGLDALALLRKVRPDVILMDLGMPDLGGLEATRRLKAIPGMANVPVIMVTGKSEGSVVIDSLGAGAAGFLVKPLDRSALTGKLTRVLQARTTAKV